MKPIRRIALAAALVAAGSFGGMVIDQVITAPRQPVHLLLTSSGGSQDGIGSLIFRAVAATIAKFIR